MATTAEHHSYGGKGPMEMGVTWTLTIIATIAVGARVYVSFALLERPAWDLLWAVLAWLTAFVGQIFQTIAAHYGIGNHIHHLNHFEIVQALKYDWLGRMIGVWASFFGKNVVIALMLRIQGPMHPKKTLLLHFIWITNFLLTIALIAVLCGRCDPVALWWNKSLHGTCDRISSSITEKFGIFQSSWTTASDFVLAIYPVFIFWNLSMTWKRKAGLSAVMGAGIIAGIVNIFKTIQVQLAYANADVTYNLANLLIFTSVEPWLIIICGSLPPIRALFLTVKNKTMASSASGMGGYHNSRRRTGNPGAEVVGLKNVSSRHWSQGWSKEAAASTNQSNESQEDILPQRAVVSHKTRAGATNSLPVFNHEGIMVHRGYDVESEPRAL